MVKKTLLILHERNSNLDYKDILKNTRGIFFIGVQHERFDSACWVSFDANYQKTVSMGIFTNTAILLNLVKNSTTLSTIFNQFVDMARDIMIYTF